MLKPKEIIERLRDNERQWFRNLSDGRIVDAKADGVGRYSGNPAWEPIARKEVADHAWKLLKAEMESGALKLDELKRANETAPEIVFDDDSAVVAASKAARQEAEKTSRAITDEVKAISSRASQLEHEKQKLPEVAR